MAKFKDSFFLNSRGQSVVEYILLLAVLSALTFTFLNNKRFKEFIAGKGFFENVRKGMEYSYRFGRELKSDADFTRGENFQYMSREHDTYYNSAQGESRFFTGIDKYGTE